jgi:hypothetical protein
VSLWLEGVVWALVALVAGAALLLHRQMNVLHDALAVLDVAVPPL